jgi:glycine/D-amino acid oxidase-like deaminating enzyme
MSGALAVGCVAGSWGYSVAMTTDGTSDAASIGISRSSMWLSRERRPFPALMGDLDVDLAVIGGGWVGLQTALLAQRDGARVAVVEASSIGSGTTGYSTAKLTSQHGLIYADLLNRHGTDVASQYAVANTTGIALVTRLIEELGIDCDLTSAAAYAYTLDPARRSDVEREVTVAQQLGLPASLDTTAGLPIEIEAAVRFDDQFHLDPVRYLDAVAEALVAAGGSVFERTRVTAIDELRDQTVSITTDQGTIRASQAIVTTLLPIGTLGGYFAKTRPVGAYGIAVSLKGPAPAAMSIQVDPPSWSTRPWLAADRNGVLVVGNGHEVGDPGDLGSADRLRQLETWARETFDVDNVVHRWFAHDYTTGDRLPYVGLAPGHQSVLVATGFKKWGLSNGAAAASLLADKLARRDTSWAAPFDAARIGDAQAVAKLIADNLHVGKEFVAGRIGNDAPTCTHLGCPLRWNAADSSWDCNCHGSRFNVDGTVLTGPAVKPLKLL